MARAGRYAWPGGGDGTPALGGGLGVAQRGGVDAAAGATELGAVARIEFLIAASAFWIRARAIFDI